MSLSPEPEKKRKHKHRSDKEHLSGSHPARDEGSSTTAGSLVESKVARVEGRPRQELSKGNMEKYPSKDRPRRHRDPRDGGYSRVVGSGYDENGRMDPRTERSLHTKLEEFSLDKPREENERDIGYKTEEEEDEYDIGHEIADNVSRVKSVVVRRNRSASAERGRDRKSRRSRSVDRGRDDRSNRRSRDRGRDDRKRQHENDASGMPRSSEAQGNDDYLASKRKKLNDPDATITMKTGGAYIPPARLRMMQEAVTDKSSAQYQRLAWETLKKSINGIINKVNVSNLVLVVRELFQENIVRGRGLLCRSIMQAQAASPTFTHVYAALVAIINTKFPQTGELLLKRLSLQFKRGFKRNDKALCLSASRFIAHLVNQQVAHEILALEVLTLMLESPTDDSVEVAIGFLKECGHKLTDVSPRGVNAIFERLRVILHEAQIDKRVQYMIEVMFAIRKDGFKDHQAVLKELELVEEDDQCTHMLTLDDAVDPEDGLNVFKLDPDYLANEEAYKDIKKELLDDDSSSEGDGSSGSGSSSDDSDDEEDNEEADAKKTLIVDQTETNLVTFRRTVYLTIQSSLDYEECAHKLLKMNIKPGQEPELCNMILDCCAQQRTYEKFFGLLAQRFCMMDKKYILPYQKMFVEQYEAIHRLETNKLRNVAKFFAHLLHTDAISWEVLQTIKLNEEDTTSSSRIFIKILFQELSEFLGLAKLNQRLKDVTLEVFFEGLFPRDKPKNTRFAINFFTSIGLGGLTDELREHLKAAPARPIIEPPPTASVPDNDSDSSSSDDSSSDSSTSDDDSSSSSSEESSEDETAYKKSKNKKKSEPRKKSRGEESRREVEPRREESRKGSKREEPRRYEETRKEVPRRVESRREEPRRGEVSRMKDLRRAESRREEPTKWAEPGTMPPTDNSAVEPTAAQMKLLALAYGEEAVRASMINKKNEDKRGGKATDRNREKREERSDDDRDNRRKKERRNDRHTEASDEDLSDRKRREKRDQSRRSYDGNERRDGKRKEKRDKNRRSDDEKDDGKRRERNNSRRANSASSSDDNERHDDRKKASRNHSDSEERSARYEKKRKQQEEERKHARHTDRHTDKHTEEDRVREMREERRNRRKREEERELKRESEEDREISRERYEDREMKREREDEIEIKREKEDSEDQGRHRHRRDSRDEERHRKKHERRRHGSSGDRAEKTHRRKRRDSSD